MKYRWSLDLQHGLRVYLMLHGVRSGIRAQRKRLPKKEKKKREWRQTRLHHLLSSKRTGLNGYDDSSGIAYQLNSTES